MSIGFLFWLLVILFVIFGGYWGFARAADKPVYFGGYGFVLVLIFLLGVGVFGWPIHG